MKRVFSYLLIFALLLSCCPIIPLQANAAVVATGASGNVCWSLDEDGTLTFSGNGPMTANALTFVYVQPWGRDIRKVVIESGISSIGDHAFDGCSELTEVVISDTVTKIGRFAFYNCQSLTAVKMGNAVEVIDYCAFSGCKNLSGIELPDSLRIIGDSAFGYCPLVNLKIPGGVTEIGADAFYNCKSIISIDLPDNAMVIGSSNGSIVYNCNKLEYKIYDSGKYLGNGENPYYALIGTTSKYITSCQIHPDTKVIGGNAFKDHAELTEIIIPEGVIGIGGGAFYGCSALTDISIPDTVINVDTYAFEGCKSLKYTTYDNAKYLGNANNPYHALVGTSNSAINSCTVHEAAKVIGGYAFYGHKNLKQLSIGNNVVTINDGAFSNCESLEEIIIPDSVTRIDERAFLYCKAANKAIIGNGVTSIGQTAFLGCGILSLQIGNRVKSIDDEAFDSCYKLREVRIPASVKTIGDGAFSSCNQLCGIWVETGNANYSSDDFGVLFNKSKTSLIQAPGGLAGHYAVPSSVSLLGKSSFAHCEQLISVEIPEGISAIGENCFYGCDQLRTITVSDEIHSIGRSAFEESGINEIYYSGTQEQWDAILVDNTDSRNKKLYSAQKYYETIITGLSVYTMPEKTVYFIDEEINLAGLCVKQEYSNGNSITIAEGFNPKRFNSSTTGEKTVYIWVGDFFTTLKMSVQECISGELNSAVEWSLTSEGVLTVSGSGYMPQSNPWRVYADRIKHVVIGSGITYVAPYAFEGCKSIEKVSLPDTVEEIGYGAFYGATGLREIILPNSVEKIQEYAFQGCAALESVWVGSGMESIYSDAFKDCESLRDIHIASVDQWVDMYFSNAGSNPLLANNHPKNLYQGDTQITCLDFPEGVETIEDFRFANIATIQTVHIPTSVTSISGNAFDGCTGIESFRVAAGSASYSNDATGVLYTGDGATLLKVPTIIVETYVVQDGTVEISTGAFGACAGLTQIVLPQSLEIIDNAAFSGCTGLTEVFYKGTSQQWEELIIGGGNVALTSAKLTVVEAVAEIEVKTEPAKTEYWAGEKLDVTGLTLYAIWSDGTKMEVAEGFVVTGYDPEVIGPQTITVTFENCSTTFRVLVKKPYVVELAVNADAAKVSYWPGEQLETEGLVLTARMSDGTTKQLTEGYVVEDFSTAISGVRKVTVSCDGVTADYLVEVYVTKDDAGKGYAYLSDAIAEANTLTLLCDTAEAVVVNRSVELDLGGFVLSGAVTVGNGCTLTVKDSQTDDYTICDANGYGKLLDVTGDVAAADGYLQINEAGELSFHKVDLVLTTMTLRPEQVGIYYNGEFFGDELVAENVDRFGIALRLDAVPDEAYMKSSSAYSWYKGFAAGAEGNKAYGTLLKNIMKQGLSNSENMERAQNKIYGRAYILTKDGRYVFGDSAGYSMMQVMQKVDAQWTKLTQTQKNAVKALYNRFEGVVGNWYLPNINDTDIDIPI